MAVFDFQRLDNILNLLINKDEAVPIDELCTYCSVSDRTIRSDISSINDYITDHGARIILLRKKGYVLEYIDREAFMQFWTHQDTGTFLFTTSESRLAYMIRLFLTTDHYVTQEYLQSILFVSQNTLYSDFRTLKQQLAPYHLTLQNKSNLGYRIQGAEQDIRSAIVNLLFKKELTDYLTATITITKDICHNIDVQQFDVLFTQYFTKEIRLDSDYFYRNIYYHLLLTTSRVKYGHTITTQIQPTPLREPFASSIAHFTDALEEYYHIHFSHYELEYMAFLIAENHPEMIDDRLTESHQELAQLIVDTIQTYLEQATRQAVWTTDSLLRKSLLEHMKLFLKVQTIEGSRSNPLLETIKNNFPYPFELAINCSRIIVQDFQIHLSEDEISYIALHLANAIERNTEATTNQVSLAIICGSGKTFSSLIEAKIKRKFPNRFSLIKKYSYVGFQAEALQSHYDLIVSTIPIKDSPSNVVSIDITDLDQSMIRIEESLNNLETLPSYQDNLFSEERFLALDKKTTKKDILSLLSDRLQQQGFVTNNFLDEVYQREQVSSTIISDTIAIPHPLNGGVKKSTIFPVVAPKGITWDDKTVKFVFLFAIQSDNSALMEQFYDKLLDFISSGDLQEKLLKNPTFEVFNSIFQ